jgi:hypothetical protein
VTKKEAFSLLEIIEMDSLVGSAETRQIGNGEWIVTIKARTWHCFSREDYDKYLQERASKHQYREAEQVIAV